MIANVLYKELGISYTDLRKMDPQEITELLLLYQLKSEISGPSSRCPLGG